MIHTYEDVDVAGLPDFVVAFLDEILRREGSEYTSHKHDYPTKWGVRHITARRAGYEGHIRDLSRDQAVKIWAMLFWILPRIYQIAEISRPVSQAVLDTAGPAGHRLAIQHLQKSLTSFNSLVLVTPTAARIIGHDGILSEDNAKVQVTRYGPDLAVDGVVGGKTLAMLQRYLDHRRSTGGEYKLVARLNCLQDAHYTAIALRRTEKRDFSYGWLTHRVYADLVKLPATGFT